MNNYKTKVNSKDESKEVQELFESLGYKKGMCSLGNYPAVIVTTQDWETGSYCSTRALGLDIPAHESYTEITLAELRAMVVLNRNDVNDATHENNFFKYVELTDGWYYFEEKWVKSSGAKPEYYEKLKPIEKTMREYLDSKRNYEFVLSTEKEEGFIEIPEGAEIAVFNDSGLAFAKPINFGSDVLVLEDGIDTEWDTTKWSSWAEFIDYGFNVVWQREQDEPFHAPECTLNDQYAEIEEVRQAIREEAQAVSGIDATLAERQTQYGCYEDVAQVTQQILSALRIGNYDKLPAPMKESLHMIASKMARIVNGDPEYFDNWHDIGGYAKLIEKLIKGE